MGYVTLVFLLLTLSGCGDSGPDAYAEGEDECGSSEAYSDYLPGLVASGLNGYSVTLVDSTPGPPEKGENRWTVAVADASGAPVPDAGLIVSPMMPQHGHGAAVQAVISPGETAGSYVADPVHFSMAGVWEITLGVALAAGASVDEAVFTLCIES
ncbi:MAG: FixH family protein [Nannocystaceae bacterium]